MWRGQTINACIHSELRAHRQCVVPGMYLRCCRCCFCCCTKNVEAITSCIRETLIRPTKKIDRGIFRENTAVCRTIHTSEDKHFRSAYELVGIILMIILRITVVVIAGIRLGAVFLYRRQYSFSCYDV